MGGDEFILIVVEEKDDVLHKLLMEAKYEIINYLNMKTLSMTFPLGLHLKMN